LKEEIELNMEETPIFDPRDSRYKTPYGAVASGRAVRFTLRPPRSAAFSRAVLTARFESRTGDDVVHIFMPWTGLEGDRDLFSGVLPTEDYVGLVWYSFQLEGPNGAGQSLEEHQLTVYDGSEKVPAWFGEGCTYQIFPDRFRRTRVPDPTGMVGGRTVHASWDEDPVYQPDEHGEIRNRDFFGGNLDGVRQKLSYLHGLGVDTLYFCPIFEAPENHRYGTGDYERIDPMLGSNEDFSTLCRAAHALGMHVMVDGVFNHTGFVSRYFNGDGSYPQPGAAQSQESPYYSWFRFHRWPDRYDSWWGIYSLPAVNEDDPGYQDYIIRAKDSIVRRWLRAGADAWRLDVADELPDHFVHGVHKAARETKASAIVLGEVWEDGSNKVAYGVRRKHILGGHCDGLMNYPFRSGLIAFLLGGDAAQFRESMETLRENYPPFAFYSSMNFLGTHDTPRILTILGVGSDCGGQSRQWRAEFRMSPEQYALGKARLKLGVLVLFAFPGSPMIYYGDEAGMEGFEDPFNRRTFPWGREDEELTAWYAAMGQARRRLLPLRRGDLRWLQAEGRVLAFSRTWAGESVAAAVNAGEKTRALRLPWSARDLLSGEYFEAAAPLYPMTGRILVRESRALTEAAEP